MTIRENRIFLLSPASTVGKRATLLMSPSSDSALSQAMNGELGVPIADVFSFLSSLYFRGKLAYASRFARPPAGHCGIYVITSCFGILPYTTRISITTLLLFHEVDVNPADHRYREPLRNSVTTLKQSVGQHCSFILLGSLATDKYTSILSPILEGDLYYPAELVGLGDMSRGGLLLRCAREGRELTYACKGRF